MKRHIFAVSSIAVAFTAQAQSSITVGGTVDVAVTRGTGSLADRSQLTSGDNLTSKLIFRGTEDLGGGYAASFWLEAGFQADNGTFQATNTNNQPSGAGAALNGGQGMTFNRRSYVSLVAPWGEVRMGRDQSPMFDLNSARYDPWALGVAIGINYSAGLVSSNGVVRVSNDVVYLSPKFNGLSVDVHRWLGENASGTATSRDGTGEGFVVKYDAGRIGGRVHWGRSRYAVAGDARFVAGGASYDFGPAKVSLVLNKDSQGAVDAKGVLVGLWVPMGAGELRASYSRFSSNAAGDPEATKLGLGYIYSLSKRTALYATLAHVRNEGGMRHAIGGATTAANQPSRGADVGFRHNF